MVAFVARYDTMSYLWKQNWSVYPHPHQCETHTCWGHRGAMIVIVPFCCWILAKIREIKKMETNISLHNSYLNSLHQYPCSWIWFPRYISIQLMSISWIIQWKGALTSYLTPEILPYSVTTQDISSFWIPLYLLLYSKYQINVQI